MRGLLRLAPAFLLLLSGCTTASVDAAPPTTLVLRGVTVIDGTGQPPAAGMDVLIENERVAGIRPSGRHRYDGTARVLDLPGRFVMPGLVDTHAHVTVLFFHREPDGTTRTEYRRDLSEHALLLLLAHGVTTVRNPSAPTAAGVALRDDVARAVIAGPRIVTSGEHLNDPRMTEAEIRAEVRRQAAAGVDMIKVYAGLRPAQVAVAIDEAHRQGVPVVGHLQSTTWTEAARLGIDAITHGLPWSTSYLPVHHRDEHARSRDFMRARVQWLERVEPEGPEIAEMIRELVERRIPVDPTLITYHTKFFGDDRRWTDHPALALVPELADRWRAGHTFVDDWTPADFARAKGRWPVVEEIVRRYHRAGVLLAAGSDLPQPWTIPGVSLHEELELLVNAGIPAAEVLRIATRNGAEALGLLDEIGTVEVGKRADLLVLSADPTADIRNTRRIEVVIQGGRVLRPAELLESRSTASGPAAGSVAGRLRPAPESVPWEQVEHGVGVVAFREPHASGLPRVDTLRIREQPNPSAPLQAMVVLDERGPGGWYTLLAGPHVQRNLAEIAYEELAVPFDSLAGSWARVVYGRSAAGLPLRGWVDTRAGGVRTLRWADLLPKHALFFPDPAKARFHGAPGGALLDIPFTPPGASAADFDLQPIRAEGEWMQVRVVVPSVCSGLPTATERTAWIRYLDSSGRPLLRARTRGC
jgi:imidazolonepropionase-like amidohydrolase